VVLAHVLLLPVVLLLGQRAAHLVLLRRRLGLAGHMLLLVRVARTGEVVDERHADGVLGVLVV
jgi:hypothetical protein